jgi:hypothetical protein
MESNKEKPKPSPRFYSDNNLFRLQDFLFYTSRYLSKKDIGFLSLQVKPKGNYEETSYCISDSYYSLLISELIKFKNPTNEGAVLAKECLTFVTAINFAIRKYQISHKIDTMLTDRKYDEEFAESKRPFLIDYSEENHGFFIPEKEERFSNVQGAEDLLCAMSKLDRGKLLRFLRTYVGASLDYSIIEWNLDKLSGCLLPKDWIKELLTVLEAGQ